MYFTGVAFACITVPMMWIAVSFHIFQFKGKNKFKKIQMCLLNIYFMNEEKESQLHQVMHQKNAPGGKPEPASLGPEPKGHWIYSSRTNYAPIQIRIQIQMHLIKYKYRGIANNSIVRQQLWGSQCA